VHLSSGVNRAGKHIHYYFNYSSQDVKVGYAYGGGTNLTDGKPVTKSQQLALGPWDVAIVEE
jgi:beta-galactosidase